MRFGHVNIVARDWRALARFYAHVFACEILAPERDLSGSVMEAGLGVVGAALQGVHLRLPGYGDGGPTLEIYAYQPLIDLPANVRRSGFGHIAFQVADITATRAAVARSVAACRASCRSLSSASRPKKGSWVVMGVAPISGCACICTQSITKIP